MTNTLSLELDRTQSSTPAAQAFPQLSAQKTITSTNLANVLSLNPELLTEQTPQRVITLTINGLEKQINARVTLSPFAINQQELLSAVRIITDSLKNIALSEPEITNTKIIKLTTLTQAVGDHNSYAMTA